MQNYTRAELLKMQEENLISAHALNSTLGVMMKSQLKLNIRIQWVQRQLDNMGPAPTPIPQNSTLTELRHMLKGLK